MVYSEYCWVKANCPVCGKTDNIPPSASTPVVLATLTPSPVQTRPNPCSHTDGTEQKQEVVGHLDVVGRQVQGGKPSRHTRTAHMRPR